MKSWKRRVLGLLLLAGVACGTSGCIFTDGTIQSCSHSSPSGFNGEVTDHGVCAIYTF